MVPHKMIAEKVILFSLITCPFVLKNLENKEPLRRYLREKEIEQEECQRIQEGEREGSEIQAQGRAYIFLKLKKLKSQLFCWAKGFVPAGFPCTRLR
jgi:hypothetical protein